MIFVQDLLNYLKYGMRFLIAQHNNKKALSRQQSCRQQQINAFVQML